ncbi:uncharacterized protein LOC106153475 [Lingula anatina]|uniref:Uncharacterized protein LOC106153475 n=1 Tax=Lingula anatina TaxID=7574 RepID=A0A1S3HCJ6_LINAN|nr:uncharacterized protein LOC106153475 [Lingula anatina]|eukprot:XP_013382869.1 uncharacterized protein LOC106153475 [Lingula anatina]
MMLRVLIGVCLVALAVCLVPDVYRRKPALTCYSCNYKNTAYGNGKYSTTFRACEDPARFGYLLAKVECHTACFARHDKNGFIYRGCFGGNHGVDASLDGCGNQAGANWCFCRSRLCNDEIPHPTCPLAGIGRRHKRCMTKPPVCSGVLCLLALAK